MIPPSQSMCVSLIDQDQAKVHRTLFQVFYCQPSPSKHRTPKPVVSLWRRAKCQLVIAMFTGKKLCKWQDCRHPRSNVPTLWTLNWKLVAPRYNLGVNPCISGLSGRGQIWTMSVWRQMLAVVGRVYHMNLRTSNFSTKTCCA